MRGYTNTFLPQNGRERGDLATVSAAVRRGYRPTTLQTADVTEPVVGGALRFVGAGGPLGVGRPLDAKTFERGLSLELVGRHLGRGRGA